jgi:metal-responsive CopG/Arc/MetJ family transcriptional regulator
VDRINIVLPAELLEQIDRAATEDNVSRSGFIQEAARTRLTKRREEREAAERLARRQKAAAEMDRLAEKFGKWDGVKILRRFRDSRSGQRP